MASTMTDNEMERLRCIIDRSMGTKITSALSMMLGETFKHDLSRLIEVEFTGIETIVEPFAHQRTCAVYLKTEGAIRFGMLFFLQENEAKVLAAKLLGKAEVENIDAIGRSSISEIGNILLAGSFLNSISESTGFQIDCSVPGFALENIRAIMGEPLAEVAATTDRLVVADAQLTSMSGISMRILVLVGIEDALKLLSSSKEVIA